jgi:hypothetical protein
MKYTYPFGQGASEEAHFEEPTTKQYAKIRLEYEGSTNLWHLVVDYAKLGKECSLPVKYVRQDHEEIVGLASHVEASLLDRGFSIKRVILEGKIIYRGDGYAQAN